MSPLLRNDAASQDGKNLMQVCGGTVAPVSARSRRTPSPLPPESGHQMRLHAYSGREKSAKEASRSALLM